MQLSRSRINRHGLAWIRPECRAAVAAQVADDGMRAQVSAWLAAGRPLVVARQPCGAMFSEASSAGTVAMGLALPPAQGKRRIALNVPADGIARYSPPLLLADAITHAPVEWQPALAELDVAAQDIGIELRVYGSLAWQALSGLCYLSLQSDIDLLWHAQSHKQLRQGIALLVRWEQSSGLRADGEVLFGGSLAVSWREWAMLENGAEQRVLVKRERSAELVAASELLELLA
ncbi:MAG: malonate decarboxylase holo-[acyl-carrier-protein] synthase [Nitrosomonadales bacterium]|nr:malonate decarboxylase holo-[acyl-carrier-protein] synthase [Nitrosomonadales bacterium]